MWGKVGINCFMMITGYFMCVSQITLKKWLKLLLQVLFYKILFFVIFVLAGYSDMSFNSIFHLIIPFGDLERNFTGCFLVFYLTIPFWNILIHNMSKRQHQLLLCLLLGCYTILGSIPICKIEFNYVSWFGVIYLISSYIRLYPLEIFKKNQFWGMITLLLVFVSIISVIYIHWKVFAGYYFVSDSNKILAVLVAVSTFLWFKNLRVPQSKIINLIGSTTFGILLIHSNSIAMRKWLWDDTFNVVGKFSLPLDQLILYSITVVITVFFVCSIIDYCRILLLERPFFKWYDKYINYKIDTLIKTE